MEEKMRCKICDYIISDSMDICPNCGAIITDKIQNRMNNRGGNYTRVKNIECLDRMEDVLTVLEHELDEILCKKR